MESKVAKAHLKQLRMTPRKVKVVLDLIRNKNVAEAAAILKTTNKIACESVEKLYVAECFVTPGKLKGMKRVMPRARGSAFRIVKRTSHVTVVLKERD